MTVAELIARLQEHPADARVCVQYTAYGDGDYEYWTEFLDPSGVNLVPGCKFGVFVDPTVVIT